MVLLGPGPWADQPYSLIPTPTAEQTKGFQQTVIDVAREMCLAHNTFIRSLNAIILQCEQVTKPQDKADFIVFCQAAIEVIHTHHEMEEVTFFPAVAEYTGVPDIMERNVEQHRAFDVGLKGFEEYIYKLTPDKYDGSELKRMLESFTPILVEHLSDEIETLLSLQQYNADPLSAIFKKMDKEVMDEIKDKACFPVDRTSPKLTRPLQHRVLPCALGCIDRTFENGKNADFPPFPFFVPYLVKWYFARKYSGSWRFMPCNFHGQPQRLRFTKEALAAA